MCEWTINWGDLPGWIGALGTLAAIGWAIFLYAGSLDDQRRAQARLLAPIGEVDARHFGEGASVDQEMDPRSTASKHLLRTGRGLSYVGPEAYLASVRLVSTSNEAFSGLRAWLVMHDDSEAFFPLGFSDMAPHEDRTWHVFYGPGEITGVMRVRLQFQDANGRWWERVNGEPVRHLPNGPQPTPPAQ